MKGLVLNDSRSSMCSPVPINIMGLFVAATLKKAPFIFIIDHFEKQYLYNKGYTSGLVKHFGVACNIGLLTKNN